MGRKTTWPLYAGDRELIDHTISFPTNGSSAPAAADVRSDCEATVARTTTGVYTITIHDKYLEIVSVGAHLQLDSPNGSVATVRSFSASSKTIVVHTVVSGSAADVAANANNQVHVFVRARNARRGGM